MDHLWSPWRLQYVTGRKPESGCVFCVAAQPGDAPPPPDSAALLVFRGRTAYVILNLYPYNNGHLLVVPYRHAATLAGLTPEELQEIALLTQRSEIALHQAYRVPGINVGINVGINLGQPAGAGIHEHLHVHLVPRWNGDTNFMTTIGSTRVLPEDLASTAARLRPIFAHLAETR